MVAKRLRQVAAEFNQGTNTIVEFLQKKGIEVENSPNTKLSEDAYSLLSQEFAASKSEKEASSELAKERKPRKNVTIEATISTTDDNELSVEVKEKIIEKAPKERIEPKPAETKVVESTGPKIIGKIDLGPKPAAKVEPKVEPKPETVQPVEPPVVEVPKTEEKPVEKVAPAPIVEEKPAVEPSAPPKIEPTVVAEKPIVSAVESSEAEQEPQKGPKVLGKLADNLLNATNRPVKKPKEKQRHQDNQRQGQHQDNQRQGQQNRNQSQRPPDNRNQQQRNDQQKPRPAGDSRPDFKKPPQEVKPTQEQISGVEIKKDPNFIQTQYESLAGPKVIGKMELPVEKKFTKKKPVGSSNDDTLSKRKRKRKRIQPDKVSTPNATTNDKENLARKNKNPKKLKKPAPKPEITDEDISKQIKETLARLSDKKKSTSVKHRRLKRDKIEAEHQEEIERAQKEQKILKVTEFVSANDLANMMNVNVNQIIATCMSLGMFVSINQRLDAETLVIVAEEFGYEVKFVDAEVMSEEAIADEESHLEDSVPRAPIVTVMGHVDHGKTSLLDYIRNTNVIAGEAGGITQHIGAYEVELGDGKKITFLDTPGHEAFTAMRARGTKVTDIAVIVIAADDNIMPQTKEAINHAQAAGVPIIFAINKIDKDGANPERIKEQLAGMNLLVEDWGGKIQSQDISAKKGINVNELMEKILLEAELLDVKANPERMAKGAVLEAFLDKGKGYVANVLVQNGTLKVGDIIIAGTTWGKIKAMYNERNKRITEAGPAQPALVLGLNSAPLAGDTFKQLKDEHEAKSIANKREQLQREQNVHSKKHITLDEIGRRLAIGDFKELNIIVKGDVDGSVEALSDSLVKLSNEEIAVNIIHKSVGQINEADVILASASDAIIIGFQVRPSLAARKLAEKEQTDIRLYSVIYKAIRRNQTRNGRYVKP